VSAASASVLLLVCGSEILHGYARRAGRDSAVFFQRRSAATAAQAGYPRVAFFLPDEDFRRIDRAAARLVDPGATVDVWSFTEWGLPYAARIAAALGVPGPDETAVGLSRDKLRWRRLLNTHGHRQVAVAAAATREELADAVDRVGLPAIVKPRTGSGSAGVYKVTTRADLDAAWAWAVRVCRNLVVEGYVDGPEYSVETQSRDGRHVVLAITAKHSTAAPHFIETGHDLPAGLPIAAREAIEAEVTAALTTLGHRTGPAHTEVRLAGDGVFCIETHLRPGGDNIWEMVELATGHNQVDLTLSGATLPAAPDLRAKHHCAIRFQVRPWARDEPTLSRVRALPFVHRVRAGALTGPVRSSDDRGGYVLTCAPSPAEAAAAAGAALAMLCDGALGEGPVREDPSGGGLSGGGLSGEVLARATAPGGGGTPDQADSGRQVVFVGRAPDTVPGPGAQVTVVTSHPVDRYTFAVPAAYRVVTLRPTAGTAEWRRVGSALGALCPVASVVPSATVASDLHHALVAGLFDRQPSRSRG
jgi:biotin carboxylase